MKVCVLSVDDQLVIDTTRDVYGFCAENGVERRHEALRPLRDTISEASQNQHWIQTLQTITSQCLIEMNKAFEACQDGLEANPWDRVPPELWEKLWDEAFETLRTKQNAVIDESKAKAKLCIQKIPLEARGEAVKWFATTFCCVLGFFNFVGGACGKAVEVMKNSVGDGWVGVLRVLRVGVSMRAEVAAEQLRGLKNSIESDGDEGPVHTGVRLSGGFDYWQVSSILLLIWVTDGVRITGCKIMRRAFFRWFRRLRRL